MPREKSCSFIPFSEFKERYLASYKPGNPENRVKKVKFPDDARGKFVKFSEALNFDPYKDWIRARIIAGPYLKSILTPEFLDLLSAFRAGRELDVLAIEKGPLDSYIPPTPKNGERPPSRLEEPDNPYSKGFVSDFFLLSMGYILEQKPYHDLEEKKREGQEKGDVLHIIAQKAGEKYENQESSNGGGRFPKHIENIYRIKNSFIDTSIDFLFLYGIRGDPQTLTGFTSVYYLFIELERLLDKEKFEWLWREIQKPQFKMRSGPSFENGKGIEVINPILSIEGNDWCFLFNCSLNRTSGIDKASNEIVQIIYNILESEEFDQKYKNNFSLKAGDLAIVNNKRAMHERNQIRNPERLVTRMYGQELSRMMRELEELHYQVYLLGERLHLNDQIKINLHGRLEELISFEEQFEEIEKQKEKIYNEYKLNEEIHNEYKLNEECDDRIVKLFKNNLAIRSIEDLKNKQGDLLKKQITIHSQFLERNREWIQEIETSGYLIMDQEDWYEETQRYYKEKQEIWWKDQEIFQEWEIESGQMQNFLKKKLNDERPQEVNSGEQSDATFPTRKNPSAPLPASKKIRKPSLKRTLKKPFDEKSLSEQIQGFLNELLKNRFSPMFPGSRNLNSQPAFEIPGTNITTNVTLNRAPGPLGGNSQKLLQEQLSTQKRLNYEELTCKDPCINEHFNEHFNSQDPIEEYPQEVYPGNKSFSNNLPHWELSTENSSNKREETYSNIENPYSVLNVLRNKSDTSEISVN